VLAATPTRRASSLALGSVRFGERITMSRAMPADCSAGWATPSVRHRARGDRFVKRSPRQ
jgi:hypothetical protein